MASGAQAFGVQMALNFGHAPGACPQVRQCLLIGLFVIVVLQLFDLGVASIWPFAEVRGGDERMAKAYVTVDEYVDAFGSCFWSCSAVMVPAMVLRVENLLACRRLVQCARPRTGEAHVGVRTERAYEPIGARLSPLASAAPAPRRQRRQRSA